MRRQLALLVIAALLPLALVSVAFEVASSKGWRAGMRHEALDDAQAAATLIGHELSADKREAQMIAQSPAFDAELDQARFSQLAGRLVEMEPHWHVISVSDVHGERVLDLPAPIAGRQNGPVVDRASQQAVVTSGRPGVGPLVLGPEKHAAFAVRAPAIRGGQVRYVVSIIVQPSSLHDLIVPGDLRPGWIVRLIDDRGTVVAATDVAPGTALTGDERTLPGGAAQGAAYSGKVAGVGPALTTWSPVPGSGWRVDVIIPQADYDAPLERGLQSIALAMLGALALAALFVWLLWRELRLERRRDAAALEGQRLEALGRMTGGIAHDFNNLLTPIIGALDLLQRRVDGDPSSRRLIDAAQQTAERARALVSRLLTFARKQRLESRDIDVPALLASLEDLLQRSVRPEVEIRLEITGDLPLAHGDPAQLELAILNLAVNANDAMPGGGVLTVRVEAQALDRPAADLGAGRYVKIAVIDTGMGMTPETLRQAIEPFFTTKAAGAGTGLGLSMVHGLAAQSGGALRLSSEVGKGVVAEIWLPAA